tara:strand:+ start:297 stop:536 length:240 start_codon:yes stop_codon:yes gene_type:complete
VNLEVLEVLEQQIQLLVHRSIVVAVVPEADTEINFHLEAEALEAEAELEVLDQLTLEAVEAELKMAQVDLLLEAADLDS